MKNLLRLISQLLMEFQMWWAAAVYGLAWPGLAYPPGLPWQQNRKSIAFFVLQSFWLSLLISSIDSLQLHSGTFFSGSLMTLEYIIALPLIHTSIKCSKSNVDDFSLLADHCWYRIVASRSTSRLVTCLGLFRLLMKGIFGPYVL